MQETEDIVTRLELCAAIVGGRGKAAMASTIEEAATTIATLRAEVEGLRAHAKKCDEWMEEAVEYVNRQMRSPSLEREGRDLRCRFAAIDAAKAGKEGA